METTARNIRDDYAALRSAWNTTPGQSHEERQEEIRRTEQDMDAHRVQQQEGDTAEEVAEAVADAINTLCAKLHAEVWSPDKYTARVYITETGGRERGYVHLSQDHRPEVIDESRIYVTKIATKEREVGDIAELIVGSDLYL